MGFQVATLSFDAVVDRLLQKNEAYHANYLAMYSSWFEGICTDPRIMLIPLDDHLVHRGDGVFEAFKCVNGFLYLLDRHLDRLARSCEIAQLSWPVSRRDLVKRIKETVRAAQSPDCLVRLYISRGPGGFSTDPYECPASQLYIVVTRMHEVPKEKLTQGVTLKSSHIPIKKSYFANVKSCNYLPNVLMTKEARDAGVDFTVSIDENGFLGEGATENVGIITKDRRFLVPRFDRILQGTTVTRMMELARDLVLSGDLAEVAEVDIRPKDAYEAAEMLIFGTTYSVLSVVAYDGRVVGDGVPGPWYHRFRAMLLQDAESGQGVRTPVWSDEDDAA
ncbi:aminotransferase class IV [Desulfosoma caldarium]|uniref:Branched-chain amino acid aminotransferase n=1 Tax=Desulfosoma caldarium TaxID=610254 RepID=A0A3N1V244_9BACT|nr:aminotransferase class IV [Desulfosoma caldarium]ROQ93576.1 branched-chain amino acid aminotransferase [Desulfosoma caldarium]